MQHFTRQLWDDRPQVTLTGYIHHNSKEYHTDKIRPAVLIFPGGGYLFTSDREAEPIALRYASYGYQAFFLRYSVYNIQEPVDFDHLPDSKGAAFPQPLFDAAAAIKTIRDHAAEWFVNPDQIAVAGFSAGGHLAASLGAHWHEPFLAEKFNVESEYLRPNALILAYPMLDYPFMKKQFAHIPEDAHGRRLMALSNMAVFGVPQPTDEQLSERNPINYVSEKTPPAFIWHTGEDDLINPAHSLNLASALAAHRVPFELHIFETGGHGLTLSDETTAVNEQQINPDAAQWFNLSLNWLKKRIW